MDDADSGGFASARSGDAFCRIFVLPGHCNHPPVLGTARLTAFVDPDRSYVWPFRACMEDHGIWPLPRCVAHEDRLGIDATMVDIGGGIPDRPRLSNHWIRLDQTNHKRRILDSGAGNRAGTSVVLFAGPLQKRRRDLWRVL